MCGASGSEVIQSIIGNYKKNEGLVPPRLSSNRLTNSVASNLGSGPKKLFGPLILELFSGAESFSAFNTCYKAADYLL